MDVHYFEPISIFYLVLALLILYPILFIILLISSKVNLLENSYMEFLQFYMLTSFGIVMD
ncbi:hypothetical protein EC501_14455 [Lysinibacillus halotolerans]|uniref:Uncharacterized protein n=1 Tax=Lysinibacillus halotolerans TaxID=1368476 RepID=A0A3M8H5D2_9BACI|nr:hypothetical protein EC501_14455 [Lysinibacillus halotolerans]